MVASLAPLARSQLFTVPFDHVLSDVHARASLHCPDQVMFLSRLRVTEGGLVNVPDVGTLSMSPWAQAQLSRMLGVKWTRWFDTTLVSPEERADEINRRLARHTGEWKIRSRRYASDESGPGDGMLRALVGPQYTPIDDHRIFDRLARVLGPRTSDFRFVRETLTDRGSQYVAVTDDDIDVGTSTPDLHRQGFVILNSEVGASALQIAMQLFRLICSNGLIIASKTARLFYRVHRETEDRSLDRDLAYALTLLPERWSTATARLRALRDHLVEEPERTLQGLLSGHVDVKPHTDAVLAAYREEPEATRFGLVQAITRAAQTLLLPEDRLALETFAGSLVMPDQVSA